ncbi:hypothetical protein CHLNCDRAFT_138705 [Chlorella variabilis]|uniref:Uncharacterized protein n=1 Tax=Chlorella variabilis TaxID=554065 RepID=E1ZNL0_CHLVA|nr:hypothetical protein CHLNCDRAFT_138705 [Chlorella variabilis]EFN52702.1 hypothetical protein CHLNCDRAFT_138705 [Chlorella variabilis]|eukprot:XP_005844804.1 hypothetical protein CHLNCDRAFT_138705 [Chlorella variabilis]
MTTADQEVLSKLLPIVIGKLGAGASPAVQKKVLEILSHCNKRTRSLPALRLPLRELAVLYAAPGTGPMARNFAIVYLEQALPALLNGISSCPQQHQDMLLRMAAQCWEHMAVTGNSFARGSEKDFAAAYPFLQQPSPSEAGPAEAGRGSGTAAADRRLVLRFALLLMLYQPTSAKGPANPLAAAQAAAGGGGSSNGPQPMDVDAAAAAVAGLPPGMSRQDVAAVEGKAAPTGEVLVRQKLGFLNFSAAAGMDPTEVLQVYLAAACDPNEQVVSRRGDELLKKRCGIDAHKPTVNLEADSVVEPLFELFHGTADDAALPEQASERRPPAGVALRARLLSIFCKSVAAASCFPHSLTTVTVCLYGRQTTPRLRQLGMEFAVWVFKHAAPQQLAPAAASILDSLLQLLDDGSTRSGDSTALTLRGFTYQAVGQLAQRQPQAFAGRTDIAARFFAALATEPPGVRAAVQEATASLASAFRDAKGETAAALQQLLLESVGQQQPEAVRMAALQWAIKLFPFAHIPARYLCILAAADPRFQIAEAAAEGLHPLKFASGGASGGSTASSRSGGGASLPAYPDFAGVLQYLQQQAFLAAISFLESCRRQAAGTTAAGSSGGMAPDSAASYLLLLENALLAAAPSELHAAALGAMLAVAAAQQGAFAAAFAADAPRQQLLLHLLGHVDAGARQAAAQLLGMLVPHLGAPPKGPAAQQPGQEVPSQGGSPTARVSALCDALLSTLRVGGADGAKHAKQEQVEGAAAGAGTPPVPQELLLSLLQQLRQLLQAPAAAAPAAASTTAGTSGLRAGAALALALAGLPLAAAGTSEGTEPARLLLPALPHAAGAAAETATLLADKDPKIAKKAAAALGYLCWAHAAAPVAATAPAGSPPGGDVDKEAADATASAAADSSSSAGGSAVGSLLEPSVSALLALRTSKNEEVLFAAGEALCFCFGGVQVTPDDILHTPFTSLAAAWKQQQQPGQGRAAQDQAQPSAMEVEGDGATAGGDAPGTSVALAAAQQQILGAVMDECLLNSRVEVRCAGAVWLVSLLLYCGRHPRLLPLLPDVQQALSSLLGDQNELTQEMASRGLAAVYDMAGEGTRKALLDSLIGTLSGAPQKRRAVKLSKDSELFEAGQLGSVPGGGTLTTYKELCSLATELGQPDLVYRFMELANHQAAVNSSRGAAFGFASIAKLAGEQLGPHIVRIIPRLYRYLYDPNGKVRDAMSHIWHALLDDPKASVTQNFDAIMRALLVDLGGGQWRVREAAALAMGDLLQGRRWGELQPHFEQLWVMTLRVMDDIKESVRQAGIALARSVRGLTLRLADVELTPAGEGRQAVGVALPLMLETGLPSTVPEVQALALDTTCKLAAAAGPELLRPHMPLLVPAMLESLSGLEDSRLNYIEQHAERLGLDAGRLEGARVAAAQGGPAGETLDLCARYADVATMAELAPRLGALVRRGVGLNTRAGAGRFITQVTRRLGGDMQPLASQLIKALTEACRSDRSPAVRKAYAAAAALLCRHAPTARVNRFVTDALASLAAEGADRDDRYVAGLLLRELGHESSDVLEAHAGEVAPPAYMAQFDEEADVAAVWREVWEESTASAGAGLRLHMTEVVKLVTSGLQSGQWSRKKAAAAAAAQICKAGADALVPHAPALLDALLKELPGRIWEGKEVVLGATGALSAACAASLAPPQRRRVVAALLEAAGKKRAAYRKEALVQLEVVLLAFGGGGADGAASGSSVAGGGSGVVAGGSGAAGEAEGAAEAGEFYPMVAPLMLELAGSYVEAAQGGGAMETDQQHQGQQQGEAHPGKAVPVAQVAACLGAAFATAGPATAQAHADAAVASLAALLCAAGKAADQMAAVAAGCRVAEHAARISAAAPGAARQATVLVPQQEGVAALLQAALRLAEEGKVAQLREQCYKLSELLLEQLWRALPEAERVAVLSRLGTAEGREKLPAIKAQASHLAAKLRQLA